jgi:murein DD-endopeptidase MepM/ murein hydrolase activator NlpD
MMNPIKRSALALAATCGAVAVAPVVQAAPLPVPADTTAATGTESVPPATPPPTTLPPTGEECPPTDSVPVSTAVPATAPTIPTTTMVDAAPVVPVTTTPGSVPSTSTPTEPCDTTSTTVPGPTDTTPTVPTTTVVDPNSPTSSVPPSGEIPTTTIDPAATTTVTEVPAVPAETAPSETTTTIATATATATAIAEPLPSTGESATNSGATPTSSNPPLPPENPTWTGQGVPRFVVPSIPGSTALQPGRTPAGERVVLAENVDVILATIRGLESSNRYDIGPNRALASGAYQYIPRTWNNYGGYAEAYLAPPEVQDERARGDVERILAMYGGNVAMVPIMWYYPRAAVEPLWMDRVPNPGGGNRLTIREYQTMWLAKLDANASALLGTYVATPEAPAALSVVSAIPTPSTTVPVDPSAADAAIVPPTAVAPTTVPAPTIPATTVPATTIPATTIPATTVPATTIPATTTPATTVPGVTVPALIGPPAPVAPSVGPPAPTTTLTPTTTVPPPRIVADEITVSGSTMELAARSVPPAYEPTPNAGSARTIVFPVLGPVAYADGWMDSRDGGRRLHEGTDIVGVQMQPILAAVDGEITRLQPESMGIRGVAITIRDSEGWRYNYFHDNNDTPGTDDGQATSAFRLAPGLAVGSQVVAGQIIAYMGDSGNAEDSVTHLHFEFRDPSGIARPSYWSLRSAEARQACTIGIGPWSTPTLSPSAEAAALTQVAGATTEAGFVAPDDVATATTPDATAEPLVEHTVVTPLFGEGQWVIDSDGRVTATGDAALILPRRDLQCDPGPATAFGTDAAGWRQITSSIVDGTVLEGADLSRTILADVVPDPPEPPSTDVPLPTDPPTPTKTVVGTAPSPVPVTPIATLASVGLWSGSQTGAVDAPAPAPTPGTLPVADTEPIGEPLAFVDTATGETIIVRFERPIRPDLLIGPH